MSSTHGHHDVPATGSSPQCVADLALDREWRITTFQNGLWITAEWSLEHAGNRWTVGLTPVQTKVAAIMWRDDEVIGHARGTEAAMCQVVQDWVTEIRAGRCPLRNVPEPDSPQP